MEVEVHSIIAVIVVVGLLFELGFGLALLKGKPREASRALSLHVASNALFLYFLYASLRSGLLLPFEGLYLYLSAAVCLCFLFWAVSVYFVIALIIALDSSDKN